MAKAKTPAMPDTRTLRRLMEEYLEMLTRAGETRNGQCAAAFPIFRQAEKSLER